MLLFSQFLLFRNGTKRWRYAQSGREDGKANDELSVIIHATTLDLDMQKFAGNFLYQFLLFDQIY
jgi:hypothetical protein